MSRKRPHDEDDEVFSDQEQYTWVKDFFMGVTNRQESQTSIDKSSQRPKKRVRIQEELQQQSAASPNTSLNEKQCNTGDYEITALDLHAVAVQLDTIQQNKDNRKGKHAANKFPDHDLAIDDYESELRIQTQIFADAEFAKSIANAEDDDFTILNTISREEADARQDRQVTAAQSAISMVECLICVMEVVSDQVVTLP
jgi:hypothetical protein